MSILLTKGNVEDVFKVLDNHNINSALMLDTKLKELEIIKEKKVNVNLLIALIEYSKKMPETKPLEIYNNSYIDGMELTQDEFDLLKRWANE